MCDNCCGMSRSASDSRTTTGIGSSSEERAPIQDGQGPKMDVRPIEGIDISTMTIGDDEVIDKLREEDALCLTNTNKFLPELAWRLVIEKMKENTDIDNCFHASPFFGDFLREKREREVVLPTVFRALAKRYCNEKSNDESYKETNLESITWQRPAQTEEPHMMTGLWKCRLVCKKWNEAIEEIHQNEDAGHYLMWNDFYKADNDKFGRKWGNARFDGESRVVKFLGHFQGTHFDDLRKESKKCPFLGRFVEIVYDTHYLEDVNAYSNRLLEMFEKFGDQVWYLRFYWWKCHSKDYPAYIYQKLKQIVELMPNLKVLSVGNLGYLGYEAQNKLLGQALEEEIQRNPFPELTKLKMISADRIPGVFCGHLVNQNRQISRLETRFMDFNGNCSIFPNKLPNLSHLSLNDVSVEILEAFESYPGTFNLEKFYFCCTRGFPFLQWSRLFNAINSKINSDFLTDLVLSFPRPTTDAGRMSVLEDSLKCRLKLANIQRCKLISDDRFCLDFLLESKNYLREVKIRLSCDPANGNGEQEELKDKQVIKFLGFEKDMEQSNIAKQLPRLRELKVKTRNGKRSLKNSKRRYYF